jgi:DNA polymerase-3 subunit chi
MVRKIYYDSKIKVGSPLVIKCCDQYQLKFLDEFLYKFSNEDFIPHVKETDLLSSETPVILIQEPWFPNKNIQPNIFLNLDIDVDKTFSTFDRVVEIITPVEKDKKIGRKKFSFYRSRGYKIFNHDIGE